MRWGDLFKRFLLLFLIFGFVSCASKEEQAQEHFKKGFGHQNAGEPEKAIEEYQKALELNPNLAQAHTNLGTVFLGQEDYDKAIDHFKKVMELNYYDTKAHYNLGLAYLYKGEVEKAQEEVKFLKSLRSEFGDVLERKIKERESMP
ncbi:MAG: tetratricopeptide repeat protein [candidate division Zixibacteria bacterium]|nr:tetratricopeptide repeat protein [candidate division Zixibacteria bacterium]